MSDRGFCITLILILSLAMPLGAQDPRFESVPTGTATPAVLSLGLREVIDRAVKNNLATILGTESERVADAKRLQDRAEMLPKVDGFVAAEQRQVNLAAFGFTGFPGINQVIGPFGLVDARATFSQSILDFELRHNLRESTENQRAAKLTYANTREAVALSVADQYFQVVSSQSRVVSTEAQLLRAKALYDRAVDLKGAGVAPGIDVVRAEVEMRTVEQRLIQAKNIVQKEKLGLARSIGLPLSQEFVLSDILPPEGQPIPSRDSLLVEAFERRADAQASEARVRAAEEDVKSAKGRSMPNVSFKGDYGAIGSSPVESHGTYSLRFEVRMPVFDRNIGSEVLEKEAVLRQRSAERGSLRGHIELEVRAALLDLDSTAEQLGVARQSQALAMQQLDQAQDRFSAGVANNLEVVQAQEAVALADEGVTQALYGFNVARVLLARATGSAEKSLYEFFPGSSPR